MFLSFLSADALLHLVRGAPAARCCGLPVHPAPVALAPRSYPEATWKVGPDGHLFLSWKMKTK